jgi:hypothetical protein
LGDRQQVFELAFGKAAMLVGDDASFPETAKLAALQGAHVLLVPFAPQEEWESRYGLPSRAAENRVCVVACAAAAEAGLGMIASLERDFTLMTPWREREFDGFINQPLVTRQADGAGITLATIHPAAAANKLMSAHTDLLEGRPYKLCHDLVDPALVPVDDTALRLRRVLRDHIVGPAHVGFVVEDMAVAVAGFKRLYGIEDADIDYQPEAGEDAPTRFAFFSVGGLQFELIEPVSEYFRDILLAMPSGCAGINHVAWQVDDAEAAVALLAAQGIEPGHVTPDGVIDLGAKKMVYLDPAHTDGLVVELIELKDPAGD